MAANIVRVYKVDEAALRRDLSAALKDHPRLAAWYNDRTGDYGAWASNRVAYRMEQAVANYARPIAKRAMELLRESKRQHNLPDRFFYAMHGFALMDSVQGTRERVFSHDEWDDAVDTYFAAARALAADPTSMRVYAERHNVIYWHPAVPDGTRFRGIDALFNAINRESTSRYRALLTQPLLQYDRNVIDLPFKYVPNPPPDMEEGRTLIASMLTFSIRTRKDAQDELEFVFFPLLAAPLLSVARDHRDAYADIQAGGTWRLMRPKSQYGQPEPVTDSSGKAITFYLDLPITYRIPLTNEAVNAFTGRRLRRQLVNALVSAGYKELAKAPRDLMGPRAFYEDSLGRIDIRQPRGSSTLTE